MITLPGESRKVNFLSEMLYPWTLWPFAGPRRQALLHEINTCRTYRKTPVSSHDVQGDRRAA
jgi:hypothetical protein